MPQNATNAWSCTARLLCNHGVPVLYRTRFLERPQEANLSACNLWCSLLVYRLLPAIVAAQHWRQVGRVTMAETIASLRTKNLQLSKELDYERKQMIQLNRDKVRTQPCYQPGNPVRDRS